MTMGCDELNAGGLPLFISGLSGTRIRTVYVDKGYDAGPYIPQAASWAAVRTILGIPGKYT